MFLFGDWFLMSCVDFVCLVEKEFCRDELFFVDLEVCYFIMVDFVFFMFVFLLF